MTIYRWISNYFQTSAVYLNGIVPRVGNGFRFDEVWMNVAGQQNYLFASMDDNTRFWLGSEMVDNKYQHNAGNIFQMTKTQAGKIPRVVISDKLKAYSKSSKKVFGKKVHHVSNVEIRSKRTNKFGKNTNCYLSSK